MRYNHKTEGLVENYMYLFIDKGETKSVINDEDKEKSEWIKLEDVDSLLPYEDLKEFWKEALPIINELKKKD